MLLLLPSLACANTTPESSHFVHCYDFGCQSTANIHFTDDHWQKIRQIFSRPGLSAWLEKQQIRKAVAVMESIAGNLAGTDRDKGGNYPQQDLPRQQDCIDESTNTFQYLRALQERDLLHWHEVVGKQRRIFLLFTHWTAVIREKQGGRLFAVDSWYRDNGQPPYIQPLSKWKWRRSFSERLNP